MYFWNTFTYATLPGPLAALRDKGRGVLVMPMGTCGAPVQSPAPSNDSTEGLGTMPATLHNLPPEDEIYYTDEDAVLR